MTPAEIMANALAEEIFAIGQELIAKKSSGSIAVNEFVKHCREVRNISGPDLREGMAVLKKNGRIKWSHEAGMKWSNELGKIIFVE